MAVVLLVAREKEATRVPETVGEFYCDMAYYVFIYAFVPPIFPNPLFGFVQR